MLKLRDYPLEALASAVGTPFYLYDGGRIRETMRHFAEVAVRPGFGGRYAMKANSARPVLAAASDEGLWIDAVSGNEVLRALRAGFRGGSNPPEILLTTDVFRDNALEAILQHRVLPNLGSPGMLRELRAAGYRGPIGIRANPGFGQGHTEACDTGGPSSKHGIWPDALDEMLSEASHAEFPITILHAHIGTGPEVDEFDRNARTLVDFFADLLPRFPDAEAVSLGGGIPHPYLPGAPAYDLSAVRSTLDDASASLRVAAGRPIRVEVEPGRYLVAGGAVLVARVHDVKTTRANARGPGHTFVMVDAGFCDLIRPAMYGSYHHIEVPARSGVASEPCIVAGPLCESGDIFTRGELELLQPRMLPRPEPGDLLVLQDAGAYGASMSSNYVSMGRAPEVWWEDGSARLIARRELVDDIVSLECDQPLPLSREQSLR